MDWEQRQHEDETEGYKKFLQVAKKIKKIDYDSHWRIVPDITDPLRKYILERDIAWATVRVSLTMRQSYKRGVWDDSRYVYKPMVVVSGLFAHNREPQYVSLNMEVKPRMAMKIVEAINTVIIPKFYQTIEDTKKEWEQTKINDSVFKQNIAKVNGLIIGEDTYSGKKAGLSNCPLDLYVRESSNTINISGEMTYEEFAKLAEHNGWGK